jgi:hypothetical protein
MIFAVIVIVIVIVIIPSPGLDSALISVPCRFGRQHPHPPTELLLGSRAEPMVRQIDKRGGGTRPRLYTSFFFFHPPTTFDDPNLGAMRMTWTTRTDSRGQLNRAPDDRCYSTGVGG